jgi:xylitol oxidase
VALELTNWAGNCTYSAGAVHHPSSVAEVQELVAGLPRVKALGTGHTFNGIGDCPGGALISLSEMAPDVVIDAEAMTASVTGGTRYGVLAAELQAQGYALHNTGSLPHISVAGATATGTHGSGDRNGILSVAVSAIDLVGADGSLVTVDRANPDLPALAVGLGAFGVITRLVLDVQPTYLVRQDVYRDAPWDTVLQAFDEVMASAYSVSLIGDVGDPVIRELWLKSRAESAAGGDELQSEYFVGRHHAVAALRTVRSMGARISPHLHAAEIRTVAADELWLSPASGLDSVAIGFTWRKHPAQVKALLPEIETALAPYEPRPHWGKLFGFDPPVLASRFSRLLDFLELVKVYDPTGKFATPLLDRSHRGNPTAG